MRFPSPVPAFSRVLVLLAAVACVLPGCGGANADRATSTKLSIAIVAPRGPTDAAFVFRWTSSAPAGTVYRMTVFDGLERQVLERETRDKTFDATRDLQPLTASTPRFLWKVAVLNRNGEPVAETGLTEFVVSR